MRRLTEADRETAIRYAAREPDYNLFILGDIENHGLDGHDVEVFVHDTTSGEMPYDLMLLRYRHSYVACSHYAGFRAESAGAILQKNSVASLCGKSETVEKLIPWLPGKQARDMHLMTLTAVKTPAPDLPGSLHERPLTPDDAAMIVALYSAVKEFADRYIGQEQQQEENLRFSLGKGGRGIGIFDQDQLVSVALTSAENPLSAMLVGIATRTDYRRQGLATRLVTLLCHQCLDDGMHMICLFFENPEAGRIYRSIGFEYTGRFTLVL